MSTSAVLMMIFSMAVLWGGLAVAVVHLNRATPGGTTSFDPDAVRDHTL